MRYSIEIKKFLYSQYFYGGLRIATGISLPAVVLLVVFHNRELGFTISTGALGACVVDMPGPLKYKHNEMLACSVIGFFSALATGIATAHPLSLWLTVVPLTFVLSLIVVYGNKWPQISFATLFMMVVTLEERFTPLQALANAGWILAGGIWYTYWSTFVSRWQTHRIEQQAIAESVFTCADYLRARARFYDPAHDLDECNRQLVDKQVLAVDRQEAARDIVLRNLPKLRSGQLDAHRTMLFNLFINTVDLHELFVGAHVDHAMIRATFGGSDLMVFFRDLIEKAATDLEDIGLAVLQDRPSAQRINAKAELRAIEYEIELMRKKALPTTNPEAYSAIVSAFRRVWSAQRLIERMHRNTRVDISTQDTEMRIDQALSRFLSSRRVPWLQIFSNLTMSSPSFRHALRVTAAVAIGLWLGRLLPLTNAYWIVMTTIIILKPGYSLTKQRNTQRITGTTIGCAASIALILFVKEPPLLLAVMFASMVMSYSLLLFNYTASVVFTSSYVLLMFHMLAPGSLRIIGERAIDTALGCAIAIAASHLFPYWEYRLIGKLVNGLLSATRQYLEICWYAGKSGTAAGGVTDKPKPPTPDPAAPADKKGTGKKASALVSSATAQPTPAASAAASAIDSDIRYRLARKNVHIAFANVGQALQRMLLEPKSAQRYVAELNDLLVRVHALTAQITASAPLMMTLSQSPARTAGIVGATGWGTQPVPVVDAQALAPLRKALGIVHDNLVQAEAGVAPPPEQTSIVKQLNHELDQMVVDAERTRSESSDVAQELKGLAYQCKQMVGASFLIRKDASVIKLPT
ncbi:FUSC family protein [Mycetohabitans sp. B5]|uniref:Putative membrane protein YccC n=1 Tax=Mycetohabitans endofungorum TaxID=417203 RepID=A0A2P5K795_9BURK|nr:MULTISPECIES: FUSC family membrane protein [Mycetohabitans]MCG1054616.1 FUSC family protein [Mycetohabitans sp. B5]PPB81953.1 putative membrane protein YccC [Mycetohabitans endofungorum]